MQKNSFRIIGVLALFLLGIYLAINYILNQGAGLIKYNYRLDKEPEIEERKIINLTFDSKEKNLGIVYLNFKPIQNPDRQITFRIKNDSSPNWIYENSMPLSKIHESQYPFGFPVINDSKRSFDVEIELEGGNINEVLDLTSQHFLLATGHSFSISDLISNTNERNYFLSKKIDDLSSNPKFLLSLAVYFIPLTIYILLIVRSMDERFWVFLKKDYRNLGERLDSFFLLNKNRNFPELDGIRAWAILMVFMGHTAPWLASIVIDNPAGNTLGKNIYQVIHYMPLIGISGGTLGVDLFFMLSGFLIYRSIIKGNHKFFGFLKRRIFRLYPVYFILLLGFISTSTPFIFLANLFLTVEFFPNLAYLNPVAWTLTYEFIFYIFCAMWISLGKKFEFFGTWKAFIFIIIFVLTAQILLLTNIFEISARYSNVIRFIAFFYGVGLAKVFIEKKSPWKFLEKYSYRVLIPSLIFITFVRIQIGSSSLIQNLGVFSNSFIYILLDFAFLVTIASLLVSKDNLWKKIMRNRSLRIIGVVSYSMYLFHYVWGLPFAKRLIVGIYGAPIQMTAFIVVSFLVSLLCSVVLFHFLEKPYFLRKVLPKK